jgi:hypothetical protein
MVHSNFCSLADFTFEELKEHHECPYDQVRKLQFLFNLSDILYNCYPTLKYILGWLFHR